MFGRDGMGERVGGKGVWCMRVSQPPPLAPIHLEVGQILVPGCCWVQGMGAVTLVTPKNREWGRDIDLGP